LARGTDVWDKWWIEENSSISRLRRIKFKKQYKPMRHGGAYDRSAVNGKRPARDAAVEVVSQCAGVPPRALAGTPGLFIGIQLLESTELVCTQIPDRN